MNSTIVQSLGNGLHVPPNDANAERSALGAAILDAAALETLLALTQRRQFYSEFNRFAFDAIESLHAAGAPVDAVTLAEELTRSGRFEDCGGTHFILDLMDAVPHAANVAYYCQIVIDRWKRRATAQACEDAIRRAYELPANIDETNAAIESLADEIRQITKPSNIPPIIPLERLIADNPHLNLPIIHGLLRQGEVANIIAKSKVGKSWFTYGMALSVASGWNWLGRFPTTRSRVLMVDNELHKATFAHRVSQVALAMSIPNDFFSGQIDTTLLRGGLRGIMDLEAFFRSVQGQFGLVIIDALYRMFPGGMNENDNALMAVVYNQLDRYAEITGAAFVLVHHGSKGDQSGKDITDIGAGAGSQSRAADTHIVLRSHEEPDCAVLEAAVRSFAPVQPLPVRWCFPVWMPDESVDPSALKGRKSQREERRNMKDESDMDAILTKLREQGPHTRRALIPKTGIGKERLQRLLDKLQHSGNVTVKPVKIKGNDCNEYAIA